ncbi:MAG: hypothetical protein RMJ59_01170 [Candidatus Nitrosocaldus sp.]|nr:hypothetical protein [Candidatus Nitrosocaldus sp.]MDW8274975.1 hypothetical protein [Candidatus Nitrosocaldus sp.]
MYARGGGGGGGDGGPINAKVRAIQSGNSLDMTNPGVLRGLWCVGGIDGDSNANDIHCYLLPDGVPTPQYKTHPAVIKRDGDSSNIASCPTGAGFQASDICLWVLFPASDFPTAGHYRFVAEFTKDGNIIDLAGVDFRNHSFMVVPEFLFGSIGIVGSLLGTLYLYRKRGERVGEQ